MNSIVLFLCSFLLSFTAHAVVLVSQPTAVQDVAAVTYVNRAPPKGVMGVVLWGSHYPLSRTGDPLVATFTGLQVPTPLSNYQLSVARTWPGATAIQARGSEIGINIHSESMPANLVERFNLGTIVIHYDFLKPMAVFPKPTSKVVYSFRMEIPRSSQNGQGVNQVVAYYAFYDRVHKQSFWFGMALFDSRGFIYQQSQGFESVMWDQGTNLPIVHTTAGRTNVLADPSINGFSWTPYVGLRKYIFSVSGIQLKAAIAMLKRKYPALASRLSDSPADYDLRHFNLNPEIYAPPGSFANIGLSVKELMVESLP